MMPNTVQTMTMHRIQLVDSSRYPTTTRVMMEEAVWGMDWDTIWRRVSMSLV